MLQIYCSNSDFLCVCFWGFLIWEVFSLPGLKSQTLSPLICSCWHVLVRCLMAASVAWLCRGLPCACKVDGPTKIWVWTLLIPVVSLCLLVLGSVPLPVKPIWFQLSASWVAQVEECTWLRKAPESQIWSCVVPSFKGGYLSGFWLLLVESSGFSFTHV